MIPLAVFVVCLGIVFLAVVETAFGALMRLPQRLEAERARLRKIAGLDQPTHFHRPIERAFTADERSKVTILFGGFTWKHED